LLGCSLESNPHATADESEDHRVSLHWYARTPEVTGPRLLISKKYRTKQLLHICYAIDMQQRLSLESDLVLQENFSAIGSLSVTRDRLVTRLKAISAGQSAQPRTRDARSV
jgi:hypothetical protein